MVSLKNHISLQNINLHLESQSQLDAIASMLNLAEQSGTVRDKIALSEDLIWHEIKSTSLKGCCALIFRVVSASVRELQVFFGRFKQGIGYYSKNGQPIDLVFLITAPPKRIDDCKYLLKKIEEAMENDSLRNRLRAEQHEESVLKILSDEI